MRNIKSLLVLVMFGILLSSCGNGNIQLEKDKYPNIPNFPKFEGNVFKSEKVATIRLELDKNFKNQQQNKYYFRYLLKDSSLYIITYFSDKEFPDIPLNNQKYFVDLILIKGDRLTKHARWIDTDFDIHFDLDNNDDLAIGRRKYLANSHYRKFEEIENVPHLGEPVDTIFKAWDQRDEPLESPFFKSFSNATVGTSGRISGGGNSGYTYQHDPVSLTYYNVTYKDKIGRTKINYDYQEDPLFLKAGESVYYVTYDSDYIGTEGSSKQYTIYKITI